MSRMFAPPKPPKAEPPRKPKRHVRAPLHKFCTKDHHARLRFDGIKKCPACGHSTREPWGCVCHQNFKHSARYKSIIGPNATQEHRDRRAKYWREVAGPARKKRALAPL